MTATGKQNKRRYKSANAIFLALTLILALVTCATIWYNLTHEVNAEIWFTFWKYCISIMFIGTTPIAIWFMIGGLIDLCRLFRALSREIVDEQDDGIVRKSNHNQ
jgi:hypothetical protein